MKAFFFGNASTKQMHWTRKTSQRRVGSIIAGQRVLPAPPPPPPRNFDDSCTHLVITSCSPHRPRVAVNANRHLNLVTPYFIQLFMRFDFTLHGRHAASSNLNSSCLLLFRVYPLQLARSNFRAILTLR